MFFFLCGAGEILSSFGSVTYEDVSLPCCCSVFIYCPRSSPHESYLRFRMADPHTFCPSDMSIPGSLLVSILFSVSVWHFCLFLPLSGSFVRFSISDPSVCLFVSLRLAGICSPVCVWSVCLLFRICPERLSILLSLFRVDPLKTVATAQSQIFLEVGSLDLTW